MTSESVYVWAWIPGASSPVVAGRLDPGRVIEFTYGRSYLEREGAVALGPHLALLPGIHRPAVGLGIHGCIADAGPDAWGQRVIMRHHLGGRSGDGDIDELDTLTYLVESGSNRIGALDFQRSPTEYVARSDHASLEDLLRAADLLQAGEPLPPSLDQALLHGSSIGGARPKATLQEDDGRRELIAKFSSTSDTYPVVKAEAAAMHLARLAGVNVAPVELVEVLGRDVLLVERFDRPTDGGRRMMVSLLTLLRLDEMMARYASYHEFADLIRQGFTDPLPTLRELFRRIVVNIAVSNTDDHARNHAAFWDGQWLSLTPAYDVCPQLRSGGYTEQAIAIGRDGAKQSRFAMCVAAAEVFLLDRAEARAIVDEVVAAIHAGWDEASDLARLTAEERRQLWGRQILHPFASEV